MRAQSLRGAPIILVAGLSLGIGLSTPAATSEEPVADDVSQNDVAQVEPPAAAPVDGAMPSRVISAIKLSKWLTLTIQANGKAQLSGTPSAHDAGDYEVVLQVSTSVRFGSSTPDTYTSV